jgi:signal transduction histidine kinase
MELSVRDDGQGLAPDHLRKRGSFGLTGMRERVAALNGEMWINSAEGAGTTVQIAIPLRVCAPSDPSL